MALNLYDPYGVTAQDEVAQNNREDKLQAEPVRSIEVPVTAFMPEEPKQITMPEESVATGNKQYIVQSQNAIPPQEGQPDYPSPSAGNFKGSGVSQRGSLNTPFGARSSADIYSGGINYGVDIGVPRGTKLYAPPGEWVVVSAFNGAKVEGPRNSQRGINSGYGNSVLLQNPKTGEKLRLSHMRVGGVAVKPGMRVTQGDFLGESGASGNTAGKTGQHLDLEYYNQKGRLADPMATPYGKYYTGG